MPLGQAPGVFAAALRGRPPLPCRLVGEGVSTPVLFSAVRRGRLGSQRGMLWLKL